MNEKTNLMYLMKRLFTLFLVVSTVQLPNAALGADFALQAHRGISARFPENTELAFSQAAEIPVYKGIETDVQMTSDGVLVCMHDKTVDRTTDGVGPVSDYTYEQLKTLRIDGGTGWHERFEGRLRIPTFERYLEICKAGGKTPYVELKLISQEGIRKVVETLHRMGFDGKYVLTSFNKKYLLYASTLCDAPLEYMKKTFTSEDVDACVGLRNFVVRPRATTLTEEFVRYCHDRGLAVECWGIPVGDAALVERLASWGVLGGTCNDWRHLGLAETLPETDPKDTVDKPEGPEDAFRKE